SINVQSGYVNSIVCPGSIISPVPAAHHLLAIPVKWIGHCEDGRDTFGHLARDSHPDTLVLPRFIGRVHVRPSAVAEQANDY
ncbi:MAG: hypothetical protein ABJ059_18845, partial [Hyphomicrobiales bacterium]